MDADSREPDGDDFPWHLDVYDAHCHATDAMHNTLLIPQMKARALTLMATKSQDQERVAQTASTYAINGLADLGIETRNLCVIPCFGWHPWFSHQMYDDVGISVDPGTENFKARHYQSILSPIPQDNVLIESLPDPRSLNSFLQETRNNLENYPTALVGEIGLDKSFRLPVEWSTDIESSTDEINTTVGSQGCRLSPHHVNIDHQKAIFKAQLHLAGDMRRPVSIHGVQAHGILFNALQETWKTFEKGDHAKKKGVSGHSTDKSQVTSSQNPSRLYRPRICLHSYSGSPELVKQYSHSAISADIYFSFSTLINRMSSPKVIEVIKAVPENRILVESDFVSAGNRMDYLLQQACRGICEIKGWELESGVAKLGTNWRRFIFSDDD